MGQRVLVPLFVYLHLDQVRSVFRSQLKQWQALDLKAFGCVTSILSGTAWVDVWWYKQSERRDRRRDVNRQFPDIPADSKVALMV
jgi:hypothetical protein